METNSGEDARQSQETYVADGQQVVDAVATDTQNIVNGAVQQIGEMLAVQSDGSVDGETVVTVTDAQWSEISQQLRMASTAGLFTAFAVMMALGAVCAGYFVRGWRRD